MNTEEIITELKRLRKRWRKEPENRDVIEIQGKALKNALKVKNETYEVAQEIFEDLIEGGDKDD